jgi:predicted RNA-binding Zn-ribbon protein involved in translation (DUF1610 family)
MVGELVWMARALRHARTAIAAGDATSEMSCPKCGAAMNQHATKVDYAAGEQSPAAVDPAFNGVLQEVHQCPNCGNIEMRASVPSVV